MLCGLGALEDVPTSPNADDATSAKPFRGLGQSLALIVGEIRPVPESRALVVAGQPQIMADLIGVDRFAGVVAQVRIVRIGSVVLGLIYGKVPDLFTVQDWVIEYEDCMNEIAADYERETTRYLEDRASGMR